MLSTLLISLVGLSIRPLNCDDDGSVSEMNKRTDIISKIIMRWVGSSSATKNKFTLDRFAQRQVNIGRVTRRI